MNRILEEGKESNRSFGMRAKVAVSHVRRIRLMESAATIDMLDSIAKAVGCEPWELLLDDEGLRASIYERAIYGPKDPLASAFKVAQHLPPAPKHDAPKPKVSARRRRKPPP